MMKLESVRFYQDIPLGVHKKLTRYVLAKDADIEFESGLIKVSKFKDWNKEVYIPLANVMYFVPMDQELKGEIKAGKQPKAK